MIKNLLIGAITNYDWNKVRVFFCSYKKVKFENCHCVMFLARMSQRAIKRIESCGVTVYSMPDKYLDIPIINSRWKIYEDYLNVNPDKYNLVFTTDIRDSFFQLDVFKFYNSTKPFLGIAIEDGILTERINKNWLINAYGKDLYKTISNERIICSGTIWGTPDKFGEFCKAMWENVSSERLKGLRLQIIDQAICNFIIYHDKMFNDCLIKSNNIDGFVMTIGLRKRQDIILDNNNNILNGNRQVGAVIHQYDRFRDLSNIAFLRNCRELSPFSTMINIMAILLCIILFKFKRYISKRYSSLINKTNNKKVLFSSLYIK